MPATTAYDLDAREIERISVEFLAKRPDPTGRFVAVVAGPEHPLADVARAVERQTFDEAFGNDSGTMAAEYGRYESRSLFFVVLDRLTGLPAGAARVIEGHGAAVKTIRDAPALIGVDTTGILAAHGMTGKKIWDFATIAVLPGYRGNRSGLTISSLLYRCFLVAGKRAEVKHVVTMLDRGAHRNMLLLGAPVQPLAGSAAFEYLGSAETRALYVAFEELEPGIAAQAGRLSRPFAPIRGEIRGSGLRRTMIRRVAAGVSRRVSSGKGLDRQIVLAG
ncbi:MAG: hypothetical protein QOE51_4452 [Actinoplanes sp.]|jgi:hypothetical protein|nr:hypothetical protein [Actinoplanes sp.]